MKKFQLICDDTRVALQRFKDNTFHCCVTSPPYWQLRDYFKDGQIGLEKTPEEYINNLVDIFKEVKRVLRKDGTLWIVIGDTYSTSKKGNTQDNVNSKSRRKKLHLQQINKKIPTNIKTKNLIGIPWKLAFALQEDGWYLRCDVIWSKKNPVPDGAKDRPTRNHEYVFLLSKSSKYFYDYYAIMDEAKKKNGRSRKFGANIQRGNNRQNQNRRFIDFEKKNKRSVWNVSVGRSGGIHFSVFPEKLITPCILAGTSSKGCCPKCKKPWSRIVEKEKYFTENGEEKVYLDGTNWKSNCNCLISGTENCVVLDPFCGVSTTGVICLKSDRDYVGIDINDEYIKAGREKLFSIDPIFTEEINKGE